MSATRVATFCRGACRCRDDEHLRLGQHPGEAHLHVPGPRRHVDQQVVELSPPDVGEELLDGLGEDQPTPHECGRLVLDEEAHRDDLERTAAFDLASVRDDLAVLARESAVDTEHPGDAEAPDVRVEHSDREPASREGRREVHRHRALADAALAARDREHPCGRGDVGARCVLLRVEPCALHRRGLLLLGHLDPAHPDVRDPGEAVELGLDLASDLGLQRAPERGERDVHGHDPGGAHVDVVHHPQVDDARLQLGIHDPAEHAAHRLDAELGARRDGIGHGNTWARDREQGAVGHPQ